MINILIVDDSRTELEILKQIFTHEPGFHVVGCAHNGKEAVELAATLKPDIITMDIWMPIMDGFEATRLIMSQNPKPIVMISSNINNVELKTTFLALEAGALSVLEKPGNVTSPAFTQIRKRIVDTVRSMAEIKVVKRRFAISKHKKHPPLIPTKPTPSTKPGGFELIAIGTSVGGPQALRTIISKLPVDFPVPIVVVQHMTNGFMHGFTKWFNGNALLSIKEAENNEILKPGTVYFAPDDCHLTIARQSPHLLTKLINGEPVSGFYPSATVLLHSVAKVCGKNALGILLTGMGNDGAQGLLDLKKAHGHTIIQDPESTVVFGMAGVAESLGAVDKIVELDNMADYLIKMTTPTVT